MLISLFIHRKYKENNFSKSNGIITDFENESHTFLVQMDKTMKTFAYQLYQNVLRTYTLRIQEMFHALEG